MKQIILLASCLFALSAIKAQSKITKSSILGKWNISAVEMPGMLYYNLEKDSLALGDAIKAQIGADESQVKAMLAMMKPQMATFTKMGFQFNTDGTALMQSGPEGTQSVTYTVDEKNSIIETSEKGQTQTFKADIMNGQLRLNIKQPQGEIMVIMKKGK